MSEELQKRPVDLILYKTYQGEISDLITHMEMPLSQLEPETRLVVPNGLFRGGVYGLELQKDSLRGSAFLRYYTEMSDQAEPVPDTMRAKIQYALFNTPRQKRPDLEHEGKKYEKTWGVSTGSNGELIFFKTEWSNDIHKCNNLIDRLKAASVNNNNVILQDRVLRLIFGPIYEGLHAAYTQLRGGT
jgi:hypothetical protein